MAAIPFQTRQIFKIWQSVHVMQITLQLCCMLKESNRTSGRKKKHCNPVGEAALWLAPGTGSQHHHLWQQPAGDKDTWFLPPTSSTQKPIPATA